MLQVKELTHYLHAILTNLALFEKKCTKHLLKKKSEIIKLRASLSCTLQIPHKHC